MGTLGIVKQVPNWVIDMIKAEFDTSRSSNNLRFFCTNCGGNSISKLEVQEHHEDHKVLQVLKCSWEYGYRIDQVWELRNLIDVSGVCPYRINYGYVFFPRSRKKTEKIGRGCVVCGGTLCNEARPDFCFCSILCKLSCPDAEQHYSAAKWVNSLMPLLNEVSLGKNKKQKGSRIGVQGGDDGECCSLRLKIKPGVGVSKADVESTDQKSRFADRKTKGESSEEKGKMRNKRKLVECLKDEVEIKVFKRKRSKKGKSSDSNSDNSSISEDAVSFRKKSRKNVPCRAPFY